MHIEVLVEDSSGTALMEHLMPKLLGEAADGHTWRIHDFKGIGRIPRNMTRQMDAAKKTLLDNLPRLLVGYGRTPGYDAVLVMVDTDNRNVTAFRRELEGVLARCPNAPKTVFGLATEEIEAWYFGDRVALLEAYPRADKKVLNRYQQDAVCGTWEMLADALVKGGAESWHHPPRRYRSGGRELIMQFRISDTFTDSLSRLTADEQKATKITAFDLQQNPASPGLKFHRIDKSKDKHFWSVRVGSDLRLIIHKTESSFLLCYAEPAGDAPEHGRSPVGGDSGTGR